MSKKKIVLILVFLIAVCYVVFLALDWTRFFYPTGSVIYMRNILSKHFKLATTVFNVVLVWLAADDSINLSDTRKLRLIFVCILIGDVLLLYRYSMPGIVMFGLVQMLLIWRNGTGLAAFISSGSWKRHIRWITICTCLVGAATLLLNVAILRPLLAGSRLYPVIVVYSLLFGVSLWTAWMSIPVATFERLNALMIAAGMTFFYACDINVGIIMSPLRGTFKYIAGYLIWFFYTPALTLLALSGYAVREIFYDKLAMKEDR